MRPRLAVVLLAGLLGCNHSWPFAAGSYAPGVPRSSGPEVQLTYNPGDDHGAAWYPDGTRFIYSTQRRDRPDKDHCLATMPAAGGTISTEFCNRAPAADDSTNAYFAAAISASNRLAYMRASSYFALGSITPRYQELVVATIDHPEQATVVRSFPYLAPSGRSHDSADHVRWLSDTSLVYVGQRVDYPAGCSSCAPDTVRTGLEIVRLDIGSANPVMTILPGTDSATSLAVVLPDTVYFTRAGSSSVYRVALDSDSLMVAHVFTGIPVDLDVIGSRLAAVVSSHVVLVDLSTGGETVIGDSAAGWAHPALQPGGNHLVADYVNPDGTTDLWLLQLP